MEDTAAKVERLRRVRGSQTRGNSLYGLTDLATYCENVLLKAIIESQIRQGTYSQRLGVAPTAKYMKRGLRRSMMEMWAGIVGEDAESGGRKLHPKHQCA